MASSSRLSQMMIGLGAAAAVTGCGGSDKLPVYPTEAIVLLDDKPFGPTKVQLVPVGEKGRTTNGEVDENGKVTFTSYSPGDGVPEGEYKVVVGLVMAPPPKPFPVLYRSADRTTIKAKIEAKEKNEVVIAMDSKAGSLTKASDYEMLSRAKNSPEFNAGAEPPPTP